ncbi:hypothetical protein [Enterovibrio nigricans]|uniref:ABC-type amino acid transport system, permease component n=1 Tax=Enterovibrio nigricans DSM 22720 TaxID=1121868 RepID=A0A1T4UUM8_9GAMM|nr:hypothetical protein [Enterovibrio nigricans]PKF50963.1 hypothetical protein AT251_07655 [Enterovibrio nigricans]SKA56131.1 ABC-type amino acid transport system, permease component [Enterovibrio nigricans DSM 22720]
MEGGLEIAQKMLIGLPHAQPGGLVLTWCLFLSTIALSVPLSYVLVCVCSKRQFSQVGAGASFALLRAIPPLVIIFTIDFFLPLETFTKGILALTLYSMSHLVPIFAKYLHLYPESLVRVEDVLKLGLLARYARFRAYWVFKKSFPAMHTHFVSLFKDTSIVILIGLLELSALTNLLASRAYRLSDWLTIFAICSALYFFNVQLLNLVGEGLRHTVFRSTYTMTRSIN